MLLSKTILLITFLIHFNRIPSSWLLCKCKLWHIYNISIAFNSISVISCCIMFFRFNGKMKLFVKVSIPDFHLVFLVFVRCWYVVYFIWIWILKCKHTSLNENHSNERWISILLIMLLFSHILRVVFRSIILCHSSKPKKDVI